MYGLNCIDSYWAYLTKPYIPLFQFDADLERGQIYAIGGWPCGYRNIYVDYTAGYTSSNMPKDLQLAVKILVKYLYEKINESTFGIDQYRVGIGSTLSFFEKGDIPKEAANILFGYKRHRV